MMFYHDSVTAFVTRCKDTCMTESSSLMLTTMSVSYLRHCSPFPPPPPPFSCFSLADSDRDGGFERFICVLMSIDIRG